MVGKGCVSHVIVQGFDVANGDNVVLDLSNQMYANVILGDHVIGHES